MHAKAQPKYVEDQSNKVNNIGMIIYEYKNHMTIAEEHIFADVNNLGSRMAKLYC